MRAKLATAELQTEANGDFEKWGVKAEAKEKPSGSAMGVAGRWRQYGPERRSRESSSKSKAARHVATTRGSGSE
jgi:hypothetical protein